MTRKQERLALAERVEKAPGPNRELDIQIALAIDWSASEWASGEYSIRAYVEDYGMEDAVNNAEAALPALWHDLPLFTSSLDAAMQLVPEKYRDDFLIDAMGAYLGPDYMYFSEGEAHFIGRGATLALALTAACLRAIAASQES